MMSLPATKSRKAQSSVEVLTRTALLATMVLPSMGKLAHGQNPPSALPEISVVEPAPKSTYQRCVDVKIGEERSFNCLNETLKRKVDQVNPSPNMAPIDARSSDLKVGTVNMPGVQQQYGQNFGRSVVPYRPPPLIFTQPIGRR